jgi:hypothetical protein
MNEHDDTPTDRIIPIRPASDAALRLAEACTLLQWIALEFGKAGARIDGLPTDEQRIFLRKTCDHGRRTVRNLSALIEDLDG